MSYFLVTQNYCPTLQIGHGVVTFPEGRYLGSKPSIMCKNGYEVKGYVDELKCVIDPSMKEKGKWSEIQVACARKLLELTCSFLYCHFTD